MDKRYKFLSNDDLNNLYDLPMPPIIKAQKTRLMDFHREYLEKATFFCLATGSQNGFDASPRGGEPGMIQVIDETTICFADWPGNNRIESLRNIVKDNRIGMLFIFPGLNIFMRINGRAGITVDESVLERLSEKGRRPKTAIVISIDDVLFHCGKAISRAKLWKEESKIDRTAISSPGVMMKELASIEDVEAEDLDAHYAHAVEHELYE